MQVPSASGSFKHFNSTHNKSDVALYKLKIYAKVL